MKVQLLTSSAEILKIKQGLKQRDYRDLNAFYMDKFLEEAKPGEPFCFELKIAGKVKKYRRRKSIETIEYAVDFSNESVLVQLKSFYLYGLEAINSKHQNVIDKCFEFDGKSPKGIIETEYDINTMSETDFVFVLRLGDIISQ